jgi:hypothetical protein
MSDDFTEDKIARLRATTDMKQKAAIVELAHAPVEDDGLEKSCENCIYFLPRLGWCDLPELNIPVDAEWYCVLWRV